MPRPNEDTTMRVPPERFPPGFRRPTFAALALLAGLATAGDDPATPAGAGMQEAATPPATRASTPATIGDGAARDALRAAIGRALSAPAPDTAPADPRLAFRRDPEISREVQRRMLEAGARTPGTRRGMEGLFASGALLREYDALLSRFGYSPQNLADVIAAYLVVSWEIVNERDSNDEPAGQRAVRAQLVAPLAADPAILAMSDAEKQAYAEQLAYMTMILGAGYQDVRRRGQRRQLADMQTAVRGNVLATGVDLERMALTPQGLLPR
ncbi:DUF6683 family protein [Coralloluteibacterium thermophilus]|uniref:DUF6683 family protein n=1 Tax=Coralloluteibacterium thermophilum TaxID=2707049 RepID=A0ABV9NTM6_9GAMM